MGVVISDSLWYDSRLFERSREIISSYTSQMQHSRGGRGSFSDAWCTIFLFSDDSFDNGKLLAFQQGIEPCNESNCRYGGVCEEDSNGRSQCLCRIYCARQYDPVCGTDGKTYNNPCLMRAASCQYQRDITRLRYGKCGKYESWYMVRSSWCRSSSLWSALAEPLT